MIWLRIGQVAGSCERGDETSGSTKRGKFLDQQEQLAFQKKNSAPWS
jgi:hypothetical protein